MYEFFTDDELRCKCCGELRMDPNFMSLLIAARRILDKPMLITSGYRCKKHNADVGSTSENHVLGRAVDVAWYNGNHLWLLINAAITARFPGIGIGKTFIHLDNNRAYPAMWIY